MAVPNKSWAEPGGDSDLANPQLPVPQIVKVLDKGNLEFWAKRGGGGGVSDAEIKWMTDQRELVFSVPQLVKDYGEVEAAEIVQEVEKAKMPKTVAGALAWPGVATRWCRFFAWWRALSQDERPADAVQALAGFSRSVGRVRTFRALALDAEGLKRILQEDEIFPSGRLREGVDAAYLRKVVDTHGVMKVAVVRLFISHMPKIGGIDPSISLHDDWQTTSVIASGYANRGKRVHLFELSVPAVETLGWTLQEVAERSGPILGPEYASHEPWFCFPSPAAPRGTWFDSTLQRTERYGLFSVPLLRNRLRRLYMFDSVAELGHAVSPFAADMDLRHAAHPNGQLESTPSGRNISEQIQTQKIPCVCLLSGRMLDVDLRGVTTAGDARHSIAETLGDLISESQVQIFRGGKELNDADYIEEEELQIVVNDRPYRYGDKYVRKVHEPGVGKKGEYHHSWWIEYDDDLPLEPCENKEAVLHLIQTFNFKRCTKVVDFFWHGTSMPLNSYFWVPQEDLQHELA